MPISKAIHHVMDVLPYVNIWPRAISIKFTRFVVISVGRKYKAQFTFPKNKKNGQVSDPPFSVNLFSGIFNGANQGAI